MLRSEWEHRWPKFTKFYENGLSDVRISSNYLQHIIQSLLKTCFFNFPGMNGERVLVYKMDQTDDCRITLSLRLNAGSVLLFRRNWGESHWRRSEWFLRSSNCLHLGTPKTFSSSSASTDNISGKGGSSEVWIALSLI
jgi:hypothetical protein